MTTKDATSLFRDADRLYCAGRFAESLAVLDQLDQEFPNTKNIMFPRARCLEKLGRFAEADALCDALIVRFGHAASSALKQRIAAQQRQAALLEVPQAAPLPSYLLDLDVDAPRTPSPRPRLAPQPESNTRNIVIIVAVIILVAAFLLPIIFGSSGKTAVPAKPTSVTSGGAAAHGSRSAPMFGIAKDGTPTFYGHGFTRWGWFFTSSAINTVWFTANLYLTLLIVGKLRHKEFSDNVMDCFAMSIACSLMSFLLCIGFVINIYMLRRTYELRLEDFLVLFGVSLASGIVVYSGIFCIAYICLV